MSEKQILLLAALLSTACGPPPVVVPLVIANATLIDPLSGQVLANHSVFIEGDRIFGVESSGRTGSFVATDSVDGTGSLAPSARPTYDVRSRIVEPFDDSPATPTR